MCVVHAIIFVAETFPSYFQQASTNGSFKQNYNLPEQAYNDDPHRPNAVPGNEHSLLVSHGESSIGLE